MTTDNPFAYIWHWASMLAIGLYENMNTIMAVILFFLNATWLCLKIYGWFKDRNVE